MTEINLPTSSAGPPEFLPVAGERRGSDEPAAKSFARRVIADVLARASAKLGLLWICLLVICAVFAPLLANSHPLLMRAGGRWSSPMVRHLSPADCVLLIAFWAGVVIMATPGLSKQSKWWIWFGALVLAIVICPFTIHPPKLVVYETYRQDQQAGKIERALYAPIAFSPDDHLRDQPEGRLTAPSAVHWAGTTSDSADLLSNLIYACRIALSIGFISTGIALIIGIIVGGLMGYYVGWIDLIGMRLVEIFDAIPTLLLLLIFVAVFTPNLYIMMAIIGATSWVGYAYFVRAEFLSLRDRDFVHAAKAAGLPLRSILFRHMLPNGLTPVIVSASFGVASAILAESTLSFLGIGLVGEASWGNLLNQALGEGGTFYWWIALYPGLAIFLTVFAYNLIGEALRDALDPKLVR
jgi:peptide/nickel transport system permease protein